MSKVSLVLYLFFLSAAASCQPHPIVPLHDRPIINNAPKELIQKHTRNLSKLQLETVLETFRLYETRYENKEYGGASFSLLALKHTMLEQQVWAQIANLCQALANSSYLEQDEDITPDKHPIVKRIHHYIHRNERLLCLFLSPKKQYKPWWYRYLFKFRER